MEAAGIAVINTVAASDAELVSWARDGDDAAFEELFRRYRPRVAAFVNGIVRDEGRAEDVTQEAFLSALRRLRESEREIVFKPWIFQIARNASIDLYRRGTRTEEVPIGVDGGLPAGEVARLPGHAGPDSSLLDKERFDHLRGALDELSESHHRIIVLRELEGLSYREIAERMELTPAAVESTLFRARRKLEHEYVQLDTGRRCQAMAALIGRLAEGLESARDRRRLDRHARRCPACRRRARELGIEPVVPRRRGVARVAALLPLPAFLRRREAGDLPFGIGARVQDAAPLQGVVAPAALEPGVTAGKAVALAAAAALIGGGGAALAPEMPGQDGRGATPAVTEGLAPAQPRQMLLDQGLGRPLPAPVQAPQRNGRAPAPRVRALGETPAGGGGGAPAAPADAVRKGRVAPVAPVRPVEAPALSGARGGVRLPAPAEGLAPVQGITKPVADTLKAVDIPAALKQATATVSGLITPPS